MLRHLDIKNIVLIDRMAIECGRGLSALTGETGAGKSILLDALGLALGARADAGLVRHGADQASVTASFDLPPKHPVAAILHEKEIEEGESLILRRTVGKDGRSKAFINDAPVSIQLLKDVGVHLVEIHGQFETQGLLDPASHAATLDSYAGIDTTAIRKSWRGWKDAAAKLEEARRNIESMKLQEDYLRHVVKELETLDPKAGEEDILADKRRVLMNRQKMADAFTHATDIIDGEDGLQSLIGRLDASFAKMDDKDLRDALGRAKAEIDEVSYRIEKLKTGDKTENLDDIEERYFAIREAAKKHRCSSDDLPAVLDDLAQKLRLITHQDDALAEMENAVSKAKAAFAADAAKLSTQRRKYADKLAKAVNGELPDLKLEKAKFFVDCKTSDDEKEWNENGFERVQFTVSTNPQTPAGALDKIASGGELSRFMLAIKVIIAETGSVPTLIFDEVDTGIGGATADAIGERLQRLGREYQVLAVTHSPQVAARAANHYHIAKTEQKGAVITRIEPLREMTARTEEIARMLSGAEITVEARAQAEKLLKNKDAA